jgi:hypothetical protein
MVPGTPMFPLLDACPMKCVSCFIGAALQHHHKVRFNRPFFLFLRL